MYYFIMLFAISLESLSGLTEFLDSGSSIYGNILNFRFILLCWKKKISFIIIIYHLIV
jgi:hypothetical protein